MGAAPDAALAYRELLDINRLITSSLDPAVVLSTVARQATRLLGADAAALLLEDEGALRVAAADHLPDPAITARVPVGAGVMDAIRGLGRAVGLAGCVGVPLVLRGQTIGVLATYRRAPAPRDDAGDEDLLSALADQAAVALDNARAYRTAQAQAEALRQSEERFRLTFEHAPIGVALVGLDGRFLQVNQALCELVGYTVDELTGLTFQAITHPDDLDIDLALAQRLARGEIPRYQLGKRYVRKDGSIVEIMLSGSVVRARDGAPIHFIAQIEDVSERRRAEREREAAYERLRIVLEQAPVGIFLADGRGQWHANSRAADIFGRPVPPTIEVPATYAASVTDLAGNPIAYDDLPGMRALRGEQVTAIELNVRRPDGRILTILVNAAPIPSGADQPPGAVVAFEDITPLKELERLRVEWSALIAHDLRQPLSSITLYTQMLAEHLGDDPALARRVRQIRDSARRLGRMIQDLLDFSLLEARQLRLHCAVHDLADLVREVTERVALEAPDRPIEVQVRGPRAEVDVDPDRFAQILENLLTNAIKYGAPDTPVIVAVEPAGEAVDVTVTNLGRGIAPEHLPHLFQRFRTVDEARRAGVKGIGLGLHITRELVEAHGGRITAASTPGERTTFRVTLPIAARPAAPAPTLH